MRRSIQYHSRWLFSYKYMDTGETATLASSKLLKYSMPMSTFKAHGDVRGRCWHADTQNYSGKHYTDMLKTATNCYTEVLQYFLIVTEPGKLFSPCFQSLQCVKIR